MLGWGLIGFWGGVRNSSNISSDDGGDVSGDGGSYVTHGARLGFNRVLGWS